MAVWSQLDPAKSHVAYACVGVFSAIFSLVSLFFKEKLYIGESTIAGIFGLIYGPHCLKWFDPSSWGNSDYITLEITRIVLCIQIFAVAVELPRKYMLKHWLSVTLLLVPVMTVGWLIIGLFIWIIIPKINFSSSLLISACITATDPILAQSVVSGKFAQKVPGHLRNLLSAESGCNDGMAFPFIYLSMNLILHHGQAGEIIKDWICVTLLWECLFGCILGFSIGYIGKRAIKFAEEQNMIDRESFLAFYIVLAFICAGFGSILGVDDLLVSFAAGATFAWDGWFSTKTKETNISTVIDLLLNFAYFIYFGAIIPWEQFDNPDIGLSVWRLIVLAFIVIFLRRIPAVLALKPFIPDIKSWREALFVGHFGPIGVGAVFAAILSRVELLIDADNEDLNLRDLPDVGTKHWRLISIIWPVVSFFIITSIIVHGSSVAVVTLGRHLNTITLTKTFSTHTTFGNTKSSWLQRLPSLDKNGRSFSLHRVDTDAPISSGLELHSILPEDDSDYDIDNENSMNNSTLGDISRHSTVETSGVPFRHAGGMRRTEDFEKRRKDKKKKARKRKRKEFFRNARPSSHFNISLTNGSGHNRHKKDYDDELNDLGRERLQLEKEAMAGTFSLGGTRRNSILDDISRSEIDAALESRNEKESGVLSEEYEQYPTLNYTTDDESDRQATHHNHRHKRPSTYQGSITPSIHLEETPETGTTGSNQYSEKHNVTSSSSAATSSSIGNTASTCSSKQLRQRHNKNLPTFVVENSNYSPHPHPHSQHPNSPPEHHYIRPLTPSEEFLTHDDEPNLTEQENKAHVGYEDGNQIIIENEEGEIIQVVPVQHPDQSMDEESEIGASLTTTNSRGSSNIIKSGMEELKRVISPPKIIKEKHAEMQKKKKSKHKKHTKYFAYKLDNLLIIENADGDVLRRYKINHHKKGRDDLISTVNKTIVSKALQVAGLKRPDSNDQDTSLKTATDPNYEDQRRNLEKMEMPPHLNSSKNDRVEFYPLSDDEEDESDSEDEASDSEDEESDYDRTSSTSPRANDYSDDYDQGSFGSEASVEETRRRNIRYQPQTDEGDTTEDILDNNTNIRRDRTQKYRQDEGDGGEEEEKETAYERERRLNALGLGSGSRAQDDEEEDGLQVSFAPAPPKKARTKDKFKKNL
ncbi:hypothetical protein TBLA_0H01180 [Henningerozyma blattae CBS 6284]|uniref:Na+/H+ antiporter n=1 Tax=Henningerozyma blattae (strain ATCC 34711 / CBS 6284 / DSM 70876 / NBRC 10599 / NRRL Y-10934 / UCD 77-7) TaxID=1071380 RepID=I2H7Q4_HENB6|nr:hypothetical protein TBLA_0H01180 [Tetrapisispora blattae CBS 6284]CCH62406.1 hypothetical protein TBLA_0H01180 [Tetrapisispora blattae CBS 6284]